VVFSFGGICYKLINYLWSAYDPIITP